MKVKVLILVLFFGFSGGAIAAKVAESAPQTYQNNLSHYSYSWADFARIMEIYR
ncbi:hypothetical protein [Pseudanabaena sp. UWO310]|uniref:hypothetical protein n=1 Tax=Pseudanabaena sp. UWO310 TaxID=2480795 RepID=UPI0016816A4F|nr:hypothetical protein [Pseudanabaena sp. UWO310]